VAAHPRADDRHAAAAVGQLKVAPGQRRWPGIPWGLDLLSLGVAADIALATSLWIGLITWVGLTVLLWTGWIWTRRYEASPTAPERRTRIRRAIYAAIAAVAGALPILAYVRWGLDGAAVTMAVASVYGWVVIRIFPEPDEVAGVSTEGQRGITPDA
jgi:hypothetical protein